MQKRWSMKHLFLSGLLFVCWGSWAWAAEALTISLMFSSGKQRVFFVEKIKKFQQENPDLQIINRELEQEDYKSSLPKWLQDSKPHGDVLFWFAGEKLNQLVQKGWVESVDDLWAEQKFDDSFTKGSKSAVTFNGKVYGLPMSYYQWGFYYLKSVFAQNGVTPPQTWEEFLKVCETLKAKGIAPITLGSKEPWTIAGWFDYLNLRTNGLAFHQELMAGKVPYNDERVKKTFANWKPLIEKGYLLENHQDLDWRQALPFLYRGKSAMLLMGNFVIPQVPEKVLGDVGFFRFPQIDASVPYYEEAPMDILMVPANAANKAGAKKFLAFMARPEIQAEMNSSMGMISPNSQAKVGEDAFIQAGAKILGEAQGISQFYDRDTKSEMANPGMEGMSRFLKNPGDLDKILDELEAVRKKVF